MGGRAGLAALLLLAALPALAGDPPRRYSGKVEHVDLAEGVLVVEELGSGGRPVRHEVQVAVDTPIVVARRLRPREMRSPQGFVETPVSLVDVLTGDFVVLEVASQTPAGPHRAVALRITIVEAPSAR